MARALIALACLAGGCFHAPSYSPQRSLATWHDMQATRPARAAASGAPAQPGDALTAAQAYELALANNPELAIAEARAEVAAAEVDAAKQIDNPELRLTNFRVDDAVQARPGLNLGLRAPIPKPGTVRARVQAARLAADGVHGETEAARRQLRAQIDRLFARLALLHADLAELERATTLHAQRRQQIHERVDRAVATRVDLALAELAHAEARDEAARLRDELARTEAELARVIGPGAPHSFRIDPAELELTDLALDRDALTEKALRGRPELRSSQTAVGQAQAAEYLARSEAWPWLKWAQVSYYVGPSSTPSAWGFGLALDLPVFSWNRGEVRAAKALVRQRELEERAGVAAVAGEVDEALARVDRATARVQDIERDLLPRVDEAAREAEAALAAGALDPLAASDVEARRVAARRLHLAALFERRDAIIALETAVGAPLR